MGVQINGDTGNVIATKGTFSGDVGIGGTLTYEDVTNIDAVGLITARNGIEIGARPGVAASISVDGNMQVSGISTFRGNMKISGGNLNVTQPAGTEAVIKVNEATTNNSFSFKQTATQALIQTFASQPFNIRSQAGSASTSYLAFWTRDDEKLRIASNGSIGIGTTSPNNILHIENGVNSTIAFGNTAHGYKIKAHVNDAADYGLRFQDEDGVDLYRMHSSTATSNANSHLFYTAGNERVRITSAGRVGIGTDEPSGLLHISSTGSTDFVVEADSNNSNEAFNPRIIFKQDGHAAQSSIAIGGTVYDSSIDNALTIRNSVTSSGGIIFMTNNQNGSLTPYQNHLEAVERARFTSDGYFLFATTSQKNLGQGNTDTGIGLNPLGRVNASRDGAASILINRNSSSGPIQVFYLNGVQEGYINITTSGISMVNASDYRLKENETTISDGITRVKQLIPRRFNFKTDSTTVDGFFAHEVSPVVPESVFGEKDATVNEKGEGYQGLDQSKLIPVLTASIKELITKVETLEAEVAALKSN